MTRKEDTMTATPRPWKVIKTLQGDEVIDANNRSVTNRSNALEQAANAALIVKAVNERERMRKVLVDISILSGPKEAEGDDLENDLNEVHKLVEAILTDMEG